VLCRGDADEFKHCVETALCLNNVHLLFFDNMLFSQKSVDFWATRLSVPYVTLVYCGQTRGWIKMKLGMEVGLDHGHILLDGDPALPPKLHSFPNFRPMSCIAKRLDESRCQLLAVELGLGPSGPSHIVLDGDPASRPRKGHSSSPTFRLMSAVAKQLDESRCRLV